MRWTEQGEIVVNVAEQNLDLLLLELRRSIGDPGYPKKEWDKLVRALHREVKKMAEATKVQVCKSA